MQGAKSLSGTRRSAYEEPTGLGGLGGGGGGGGRATVISGGDRLSEDLFSPIWKFEMNFAMLVFRKGVVLRTWRDLEGV